MRKGGFIKHYVLICWTLIFSISSWSANANQQELVEISMPADGSCLFWAIAAGDNLTGGRKYDHQWRIRKNRLRQGVANMLASGEFTNELAVVLTSDENPYHNQQSYIQALSNGSLWGGELEILAMSKLLGKNIIYHADGQPNITYPADIPYKKSIHIRHASRNHYNLLYQKEQAL